MISVNLQSAIANLKFVKAKARSLERYPHTKQLADNTYKQSYINIGG